MVISLSSILYGKRARHLLCALFLIPLGAHALQASTIALADYRERVGQATLALDSLQSMDEDTSEKERTARIASTLRAVRAALPPTQAVEWNDEIFQANNRWL